MAFLDLSVKGKPSPRHERPFSGKRSGYNGQNVNTKANIFGVTDSSSIVKDKQDRSTQEVSRTNSTGSIQTKYKTPLAPRGSGDITVASRAGVITKSELDETRKTLGLDKKAELGEEQMYQVDGKWYIDKPRRPRSRKAPDGVPKLLLGALADTDDQLRKPRVNGNLHKLETPNSQSSVSWGTPVDSCYYDHLKEEKDYQVCSEEPEERLLSDQRRKPNGIPSLDLQLSHSGNEQFMKALRERNNKLKKGESKKQENANKIDVDQPWAVEPQKDAKIIKFNDEKAKLRQTRTNEIVEEALFGDELTRETKPSQQTSSSYFTPEIGAKERKRQALYNRNPTATTKNTQNALQHRLRFSARVLSKDGHDAHRELNGFFFPDDNTLTVYEFRQFGSRSSALPFIQRGTYYHGNGKSKDQPYCVQDFVVGSNLIFETEGQLSLPDNLKRRHLVTLRITDVDREAKQRIAFKGQNSPIGAVSSSHELLRRPLDKDESKSSELIQNLHAHMRMQLKKRGVKSMTALGRYFQSLDKSGEGVLDKDELQDALKKFNIQIPPERFDEVWSIVDTNHDGVLDYAEFTRNFIGEMNESRKALVLKAFRRMDPGKRGVVTFMDMAKFFSARQHPHVLAGKVTENEVQQELLSTFEHCRKQGEVIYAEFEDYFEGLSLTIDNDEDFIMIMRNCWGI